MDFLSLRESSRKQVENLGYSFNSKLPLLDDFKITWKPDEILARILAMHACSACSYGFDKKKALRWLENEGLTSQLIEEEVLYLQGKSENRRNIFNWRVEALWSLTWAAGYHDSLDFGQECSNDFVRLFPDLKTMETSFEFRKNLCLRSKQEIATAVDLAYCLHWAVVEERIKGMTSDKKKIQGQAIVERRHGLEWLIGVVPWNEVTMDT